MGKPTLTKLSKRFSCDTCGARPGDRCCGVGVNKGRKTKLKRSHMSRLIKAARHKEKQNEN